MIESSQFCQRVETAEDLKFVEKIAEKQEGLDLRRVETAKHRATFNLWRILCQALI